MLCRAGRRGVDLRYAQKPAVDEPRTLDASETSIAQWVRRRSIASRARQTIENSACLSMDLRMENCFRQHRRRAA